MHNRKKTVFHRIKLKYCSISTGNSIICSDIWHKYHEGYFEIVIISRAVRQVKFETILKYHEWYLCQLPRTKHAIICL